MCLGPYGVLDHQRLLECSTETCGEQYCGACAELIRGLPAEHPFSCASCKKNISVKHNLTIQKYLIWPGVRKMYGTRNFDEWKSKSEVPSYDHLSRDVRFRRIHLQSWLHTFRSKLPQAAPFELVDELLLADGNGLCESLIDLEKILVDLRPEIKDRFNKVEESWKVYNRQMKGFGTLYEKLAHIIEQLKNGEESNVIGSSAIGKAGRHSLGTPVLEMNVPSIDKIHHHVDYWKRHLESSTETFKSLRANHPTRNIPTEELDKAMKELQTLRDFEAELLSLRGILKNVEAYAKEYQSLLQDKTHSDIPCSRFIILMEKLRERTNKLEIAVHFPTMTQLVSQWQSDCAADENFKPKVLDLFQATEGDIERLFKDDECIYSIPYKIGVIGHTSVGKSAFVIALSNITEFAGMLDLERSTFGYLSFDTSDYKHPTSQRTLPITFIDVEGATDADDKQSTGNYIELITAADCDAYIIVIDRQFGKHNQTCLNYIEGKLHRRCLIVRSKADQLFSEFSRQDEIDVRSTHIKMRQHSLITYEDKPLGKEIYLTAAGAKDGSPGDGFDLSKLKKEIRRLAATDYRCQRLCQLAALALQTAVNVCFRRSSVVSKTAYGLLAAGATLVPLLDEVPAYFGRENVRQNLGTHDSSTVTNFFRGTTDSLEEFLTDRHFFLPKRYLKSGQFGYLTSKDYDASTATHNDESNQCLESTLERLYVNETFPQSVTRSGGHAVYVPANVAHHAAQITSVTLKLVDEVLPRAISVAVVGLKTASLVVVIASGVLIIPFGAWAFYSTGKRMNRHLHLLCNDLQLIFGYFIVHVCNQCSSKIQLPNLPDTDNESSELDDGDD